MKYLRDIVIEKLDKDSSRARLALGKIYEIIGTVYSWDKGYAIDELEYRKVEEIAETLKEFFDKDKENKENILLVLVSNL